MISLSPFTQRVLERKGIYGTVVLFSKVVDFWGLQSSHWKKITVLIGRNFC
jgi:hypothetical protein